MITIKLLGGLGNQMFQRAFGLALESQGHQVQYNRTALVEGTHREYSLGRFGELPFGAPSGPTFVEESMRFDSGNLSVPETCTMIGYWQTERYFEHIKSEVRDAFRNHEPYMLSRARPVVADYWDKIYRSNAVAIHVRRQDYVNLQHFHGMPGLDYYGNAIKFLYERYHDLKYFIFSDDPQWCRENFDSSFAVVSGTDKYEDLRLMSSCKRAIIANSSFSWWGAWLGDTSLDRTVIAPKRWFADETAEANATDIVPERWIRL